MLVSSLTRRCAALLLLAAAPALPRPALAQADGSRPFLSSLFTDNMVLQRGRPDAVWGWATPGQSVVVKMGGKAARAVARPDGKWTARIGPFPAGGPYTLTVSGPQSVTLRNVLVGDVWLCTGQSNMEFGLGNVVDADKQTALANHPNVRLLIIDHQTSASPERTAPGNPWAVCTPQSVRRGGWNGFSAVGYFFGRDLNESQHVPIGLIESDWGGTPAEAWTSAQALKQKVPDFDPQIAQLDAARADAGGQAQHMADWYAKNDPGTPGNWQEGALDDAAWKTIALPGLFQDANIPELGGINGVVWFRRAFDLPAADAGKAAVLHLMADDNDTTWINGIRVGATEGYNTPRAYPVPAGVLKPTGNVVAVRVLDTGGKGGIYGEPAGLNLNVPGGQPVALAGPWRFHVGISLAQASPLPVSPAGNPNLPTVLYNGMIAPLLPDGIKGAIWYQGESNAGRALQYQALLPAMIGDWRARFGQGNFPFLIVQLAGFQPGGDAFAEVREAQMLTAKNVPNAGIAAAIDIGDAGDIHPKNKEEVGRRLALVAEAKVYGGAAEYSGPVYKSMAPVGSALRLSFSHIGGGLVAKGGGPLTGFVVAGADGKFVPADAKIDGDAVLVSAPGVAAPSAVRYAWAGFPECSLYNKAGLPAFPFRTDIPVPVPDPVLPRRAGADLAAGKSYVCSDPNTHSFGIGGLTDGSWEASGAHCFATDDKDAFPKTVTIDLEKAAPLGIVTVGMPPFGATKTVRVSVSADGQAFTDVGSYVFPQRREEKHLFAFQPTPARFVRLTYPDHYEDGAGYNNTFAFTTECCVYAPLK